MRFRSIALILITTIMPLFPRGQAPAAAAFQAQDSAKFIGVWRGEFDNLPGVDLVITDEAGSLHGAILFYLHRRDGVNSPYSATPGLPEPLLDLAVEDQTLHFQVSHRRAHPPRTLHDQPVKFYLKITGKDQAELVNESGGSPVVMMKRSDY